MQKNRLEAFSDRVLAIIITIMVLDLKVPHDSDLAALQPLLPVFFCYLSSFIYLGIYWNNNHHHLFKAAGNVNGAIMWANLHLLFWLSLFPFAIGWMGENHFESVPTALYGGVVTRRDRLLHFAEPYHRRARSGLETRDSDRPRFQRQTIAGALRHRDRGGVHPPWVAGCIYVVVALVWLIPDRRLARVVDESPA